MPATILACKPRMPPAIAAGSGPRYNSGMKQLVRKPLLLAFLLSIPLWIVFDNYLVAGMAALLAAFLVAMCHALYTLGKKKRQ